MRQLARRIVRGAAISPVGRLALRPWTQRHVPIFMLHRFQSDAAAGGTSAALLDGCLRFLQEAGIRVIGLAELCRRTAAGEPVTRAVCLTVDDGYEDFQSVAAPILARHRATATVFITSRFIDGDLWFWWDRIEHAFEVTRKDHAAVSVGQFDGRWAWSSERERLAATDDFTRRCKEVPDEQKSAAIDALEAALGVLPHSDRPSKQRGLTWDAVRELQRQGIEFGGHTASHPILSRVAPAQAEREVVEGLDAIERCTGIRPLTFAYPNGRSCDFTDGVVQVLKREGILGAVTGEWGIVSKRKLAALPDPLYRLPRIGMPPSVEEFAQSVCGFDAFRQELGLS